MPSFVSQLWQPSTARSVTLDGLLPLPRGVIPSDLPPLVWPAKDPEAVEAAYLPNTGICKSLDQMNSGFDPVLLRPSRKTPIVKTLQLTRRFDSWRDAAHRRNQNPVQGL